jgi:misacylated tRNA(Ala) deacylase
VPLFRDDAYARSCEAVVVRADEAGIVLDRTVFYPTAGGQPGDVGRLELADGRALTVRDTVKAENEWVRHLVEDGSALPGPGTAATARIDWDRRHRLMRTHTCLHLLCRAVDGVVTGGAVGELRGRLDFDIPEPSLDKEAIATRIQAWIDADLPVTALWIEEAELDAKPELVRTMAVRPPRGQGRVRLIRIGDVDLQACGGTHVARTGEIGRVSVTKIEKKGRQNRRVVIELGG